MPNTLIFSLRFSSKVFHRMLMLSFVMIVFMTLFRLNLYFLSVFHATPDAVFVEVAQSFLAGFRFDMLVFGFLMIPIYFLVMAQAFSKKWPRSLFRVYKAYFCICWILICLLSFADFFHFSRYGRRMRWMDYSQWTLDILSAQMARLPPYQVWFFCIITGLLLCLGLMLLKALPFGDWKDEYSPQKGTRLEMTLRVLIPLVVIAFAARGTLQAHHLNLEHSIVSEMGPINEMALNAVWCFDK